MKTPKNDVKCSEGLSTFTAIAFVVGIYLNLLRE